LDPESHAESPDSSVIGSEEAAAASGEALVVVVVVVVVVVSAAVRVGPVLEATGCTEGDAPIVENRVC
jgi:hypothetical protein